MFTISLFESQLTEECLKDRIVVNQFLDLKLRKFSSDILSDHHRNKRLEDALKMERKTNSYQTVLSKPQMDSTTRNFMFIEQEPRTPAQIGNIYLSQNISKKS